MQNKANCRQAESNANSVFTRDYEDFLLYKSQKTNPIKPNSNPISERPKMNVSIYLQTAYKNIINWTLGENKPNQTQFQTQSNPIFISGTPLVVYNYRAVKERPIHKLVAYRP